MHRKRPHTRPNTAKQTSSTSSIQNPHPPPPGPELCRLCLLSNDGGMMPIFPSPNDETISQKIFECTTIQVDSNVDDGTPSSICSECKDLLEKYHNFRSTCLKNDGILKNLRILLKREPQDNFIPPPVVAADNSPRTPIRRIALRSASISEPTSTQSSERSRRSLADVEYGPITRKNVVAAATTSTPKVAAALPVTSSCSQIQKVKLKTSPQCEKLKPELIILLEPINVNDFIAKKPDELPQMLDSRPAALERKIPTMAERKCMTPVNLLGESSEEEDDEIIFGPVEKLDVVRPFKKRHIDSVDSLEESPSNSSIPQLTYMTDNPRPSGPCVELTPKSPRRSVIVNNLDNTPPPPLIQCRKAREKCNICGSEVINLRAHINQKHSERAFSCHFCRQKYASSTVLQKHIQSHEMRRLMNKELFVCSICSLEFLRNSELYRHLNSQEHMQCLEGGVSPDTSGTPNGNREPEGLHFLDQMLLPDNLLATPATQRRPLNYFPPQNRFVSPSAVPEDEFNAFMVQNQEFIV